MSHGTCLHPGRLATCQVVQVDGLVLATLGPFVRLMFCVGPFVPQRPTPSYQRANPSIPEISIASQDISKIYIRTALTPHS